MKFTKLLQILAVSQFLVSGNASAEINWQRYTSTDLPHTFFLDIQGTKPEMYLPILNKVSASATYAVWTSQVRNGTGNDTMYSSNPVINGYYTQLLQVLSSYDLYFTYGVRRWQNKMGIDDKVTTFSASGPIDVAYAKSLDVPAVEGAQEIIRAAMDSTAPILGFTSRKFPTDEYEVGDHGVLYKADGETRKQINAGVAKKLAEIMDASAPNGATDKEAKIRRLLALGARYLPLSTETEIQVYSDKQTAKKSRSRMEVVTPAIGELDRGPNPRDTSDWEVKGIEIDLEAEGKTILNQTKTVRVYKVLYTGADRSRAADKAVVRTVIEKNFADLDHVYMTTWFGRLGTETCWGAGKSKCEAANKEDANHQLIQIDNSRIEDGVQLIGKLELPQTVKDWALDDRLLYRLRREASKWLQSVKITVSVQKLVTVLTRKSSDTAKEAFSADHPFTQKVDAKKSQISLRMNWHVLNDVGGNIFKGIVSAWQDTVGKEHAKMTFTPIDGGRKGWTAEVDFIDEAAYKNWMNLIVHLLLKKEVGSGADAALPEFQAELDQLLGDLAAKVYDSFTSSKREIERNLNSSSSPIALKAE